MVAAVRGSLRRAGGHHLLEYAQALKVRGNLERRGTNANFPHAIEVLEKSSALFRERYAHDEGRSECSSISPRRCARSGRPTGRRRWPTRRWRSPTRPCERRVRPPQRLLTQGCDPGEQWGSRRRGCGLRHRRPIYRKQIGPTHFLTLQNEGLHGMTLLQLGQRDRGLALVESSREALAKVRPDSNTHASAVEWVGTASVWIGRHERAVPGAGADALAVARPTRRGAADGVHGPARHRPAGARSLRRGALAARRGAGGAREAAGVDALLSCRGPAVAGVGGAGVGGHRPRRGGSWNGRSRPPRGTTRAELTRQLSAQAGLARVAQARTTGQRHSPRRTGQSPRRPRHGSVSSRRWRRCRSRPVAPQGAGSTYRPRASPTSRGR